LAAGKLGRAVRKAMRQAHSLQRGRGAFQAFAPPHARVDQGRFHILQRAAPLQQVEGLKHEAHLPVAGPRHLAGVHF